MPLQPNGDIPIATPSSGLGDALRRERRRVVLVYLLLAIAWVASSDAAVYAIVADPRQAAWLQTAKGLFFIFASATLLYLLLRPFGANLLQVTTRLAASDKRHRQAFVGNPGPVLIYDLQTARILDANPSACTLFGWEREQLLGQPIGCLWPPGAEAQLDAKLEQLREHPEQTCVLRSALQLRDGTVRQMELRSNAIDVDERPARLLIVIDRTAEDEALARRDQALARVEEAHELARIGAWQLDPATGLASFSRQVYLLLGRRPPQARTWHRFDELLVPADAATAAMTEQLLAGMSSGEPVHVDVLLPLLGMDGRPLMTHLRAESGLDDAGRPRVLGTLQDVTEREQSRRLLREREEQFRELVRVLPDGVVILSDEHVLYANAFAVRLFGYDGHTLLGEPLQALVAESGLSSVRALLRDRVPEDTAGHAIVSSMQRVDGSGFQAGLSVGEVRYGGRDCRLLIVRDLSDTERTRIALENSNRELHAMAGRLFSLQEDERRAISRDLHDDIGQAITAIKLSAWAALDEEDGARRREDLQQIVGLADSTVGKLRDLSMLLRPPQLDALGLEAALRWQAGVLFRASQTELLAHIDTLPERPDNAIEQACFRIAQESLTNALRHARASQVLLHLRDIGQGRLHLQVRDDGEGFDPHGPRGLGLIVMRERAQSVGGQLRIQSAPGEGTLIELHLPYRVDTRSTHALEHLP
ncbi:PAS domain S-box protein [Stenotrophomonas sp. CFBP 13718]|uniref:sensor histidine kinase n=1 Tax=Stenotrophomonas sp. CFBP 13718 TaxID=2775304 RepID=UPI00177D4840|nr:PAS domain S-box protein [Stenotrophomonas sp. CFBP 13718]MBD8694703.1 PAS domain S-box protein [Stenotrophomonas sp. CFBP 13718]